MICSLCLLDTPELQETDEHDTCPLCGTNYSTWRHAPYVMLSPRGAWDETRKLRPTGAAHTDRLVAARLSVRSAE